MTGLTIGQPVAILPRLVRACSLSRPGRWRGSAALRILGQSGRPALNRLSPSCRVEGHVTSGRDPLPGVSVVVHAGDALKAATSTDVDGSFAISLSRPNASYRLTAELTAFATAETHASRSARRRATRRSTFNSRSFRAAAIGAGRRCQPEADRAGGRPPGGTGAVKDFRRSTCRPTPTAKRPRPRRPTKRRMRRGCCQRDFPCRARRRTPSRFPAAATRRASTAGC